MPPREWKCSTPLRSCQQRHRFYDGIGGVEELSKIFLSATLGYVGNYYVSRNKTVPDSIGKVRKEQKMDHGCCYSYLFMLVLLTCTSYATELTFELPDSAKECFHQEIKKNTTSTLEFQVVTGGQYDVDVILQDPKGKVIYKQIKMQFDSHTFTAEYTGIYVVCFSNEFSTFSHKLVYMDFQVGDEQPLPGLGDHVTVMTQMETSAQDIHKSLTTILDYQTHHRLREAQGRKRAEDLNERVLWWSIMETVAIVTIAVGQVFVLKNFFTEKKPFHVTLK